MNEKVKKQISFGPAFIIFLTSFLTGLFFSLIIGNNDSDHLLKNINNSSFDTIIGNQKDLDLTKFWKVYSIIKDKNYDQDINKQDLVDSAISGLVEGLGDKHAEYLSVDETQRFNESLSGDFEGIGAFVEKNVLGIKIERIIKGSPAKKYGLRANDIILKSNGIELKDLDLIDGVSHIKGPAGTRASLEILRVGENDILNVDVVREKITIPSVEHEILENNIGYISLNQFGDNTASEFKKAIVELKDTDGLILDLRDNGGGFLQSSVLVLSELIEENKTVVVTKYKKLFKNIAYKSINDGEIYDKKIVVLINENSASASEITAGALRDYNKAILVGKKTYGKGSVQQPFELDDGSMVKITIAKWFTPSDKNIDKEGISADIEVDFEKQDYENNYDRQLEIAKKVLSQFQELGSLQLTIDTFNNQ